MAEMKWAWRRGKRRKLITWIIPQSFSNGVGSSSGIGSPRWQQASAQYSIWNRHYSTRLSIRKSFSPSSSSLRRSQRRSVVPNELLGQCNFQVNVSVFKSECHDHSPRGHGAAKAIWMSWIVVVNFSPRRRIRFCRHFSWAEQRKWTLIESSIAW